MFRTMGATGLVARRTVLSMVLGAAMVGGSASPAQAQSGSDAPRLITPADLEPVLQDKTTVLLHVGDKAEYDAEHLPGARHLDVRTLAIAPQSGALSLQALPPSELEARLEALGISDASRVVIYMGSRNAITQSTRAVFTLDYAGLGARTFLLDGGLPAWKAAGKSVTTEVPAPAVAGSLTIAPRAAAIADLAWVRDHAGRQGSAVVDARLTQFYTGESDNNGRIPRPGHVAGAVSLPFESLLRPDGTFKSRAELESTFTSAGIAAGTTVATYCHIGQQATVPYVAARLLGYDVKLFDGSYEEWSRTESAPVKKGTEP